jgi:hypothetical protein
MTESKFCLYVLEAIATAWLGTVTIVFGFGVWLYFAGFETMYRNMKDKMRKEDR